MFIFPILLFRELAYQIADQFRVFGGHIGVRDVVIVGGTGVYSSHIMTCNHDDVCICVCNMLHRHDETRTAVS